MSSGHIKKIEAIKNIRNFIDFSCADELSKKSIVYAPNGSGKTNLSRFLEYVSDKDLDLFTLKSLEANTGSIEFKIIFNDQTSVDQNNYISIDLEQILVYNSDYIEKSVRSNDFSDKNIDGQIEIEIDSDQIKILDLEKQLVEKNNEFNTEKISLESLLATKAAEIKEWDSRGRLVVAELVYDNLSNAKYISYLSNKNDKEVEGAIQEGWVNAKENFDQIKDLDPDHDKITYNFDKLRIDRLDFFWIENNFIKKVEFIDPPTGEVKEHIEKLTNEWIRTGLKTHEDDNVHCPFCLQDLADKGNDVILKYKAHIESEKAKFEEKIDLEIGNIISFISDLEKLNNTAKALFEIRTKNLHLTQSWAYINPGGIISKLNSIKSKLTDKRKNPQLEIFFTDKEDEEETKEKKVEKTASYFFVLKNEIEKNNSDIILNNNGVDQINRQLTSIGNRQTELRKLLGQKYLVEFYETNITSIEKRDRIFSQIELIKQEVTEAKKALPSKEVAIKIVDLFNIYIKQIGVEKYEASIQSNKIVLTLNNTYDISCDVKNILSEGEKNIIAFSYFLASSIRRLTSSEKYSNGIFVIDDPICSVGYKYFYGVCDVLKNFYKTAQNKIWTKNDSTSCPQLIILTHNVQFYNMLASNIFKEKATYFGLERENGKHLLKKLNSNKLSEYKTSLRRVKRYGDNIDIEENVGNDIRRVLETICNFHGYNELNQDNIKSILTSMSGPLLSFAHDSSHEDVNNYEDPFDPTQYKEMSTELIRLIQIYSPEILKDL